MKGGLADLNLYGFQNLNYNCTCGKVHSLGAKYILADRGCLGSLNSVLSEILPAMRVAVISGAANFIAYGAQIQSSVDLRAFNLVNFIYDDDVKPTIEKASQLFSLPEDVKAVIALGNGSEAELAKYYASVMEIPYIIIAATPELTGVFSDKAEIDLGEELAGFAVSQPFAVIADYDIISKCKPAAAASAYGALISGYLQLVDCKVSALALGKNICPELYAMYKDCVDRAACLKITDKLKAELAEISIRVSVCRALAGGLLDNAAVDAFSSILFGLGGAGCKGIADYRGFEKLIRIYKLFFGSDTDFNLFIPNFSKRAEKVRDITGRTELELLRAGKLVSVKLQRSREKAVEALKPEFSAELDEIFEKLKRAEKTMSALLQDCGQYDGYSPEQYRKAFLYCSDVASGYTLAALMRDMGILDFMDGER